jgi:hypothetical protein
LNPNPGISPAIDEQPDFIPYAAMKIEMTYNDLILKIFNEALERNNMTIKIMQLPKTASTENGKAVRENPEVTLQVEAAKPRERTRIDTDIIL